MSSAIFHRSLTKSYPIAIKADGIYFTTATGRRILDGSSGAVVSSIGHGNEEVIQAIISQAKAVEFAHTFFFSSDPAEQLAHFLVESSNDAFTKAMFFLSGSEAVESALKVARQYHVYNSQPERINFIGRESSYHGNTLGALAAGKNGLRRDTFAPILSPTFHHVSRCFYSRDGRGLSERDYEDKLIAEYRNKIESLGPSTVAAVILETVVGATLGAVGPTKNYLKRLRELTNEYGILLIFDEVMCGMGRTGHLHAWQGFGNIQPDLETIGKGLGAGYQPISALLINQKIYNVFDESARGGQSFVSGHTFQGHPIACAAALKVQSIIQRDRLIESTQQKGDLLRSLIFKTFSRPTEIEIRGFGLMRAVDFKDLRLGLHGDRQKGPPLAQEVSSESFERGATVYVCSPAVDGVMFAPPFIITEEQIAELARIFVEALEAVLARREQRSNGSINETTTVKSLTIQEVL